MMTGVHTTLLHTIIALELLLTLAPAQVGAADAPTAVGPLLKLFQSGRLPAERQGPVVEMICNRGNEHDLRVVFDRVVRVDGFSPELRVKALGWLTDAAVNRKVKPAGDLSAVEKLLADDAGAKDVALRRAVVRLGSIWKVAAISDELQTLAADTNVGIELQSAAIDGLAAIGDTAGRATIVKLADRSQPMPVRLQAIAGLTAFDLVGAADAAASALADSTAEDNCAALLDAFLNRKGGPDALAAALQQPPLSVDAAKRALRYMYSVGRSDAALSAVLSKAAGVAADPMPPTPDEVASLAKEVIAKGDAARGERIFRRADLSCQKCHSITRAGGQVGPDLSAVGGTSPVEYIVNSILNPSLAVKEQYVTKIFETSDGQVLTGVVIDRDEVRVNLRDSTGKAVTLPVTDIEQEAEGKSLMPLGLTKFLTHDELLDLARFISELGKPGDYALRQTPSIQRWRVMKSPPSELTSEVPHLEHMRQFVFGSAPDQWLPAYGKVAGTLPLDELRGTASKPVLILQGEVEVTAEGQVSFQLASTEPTQMWIDSEPFETEREVTVSLAAGRHRVTLRVEVSDRPAPELKLELTKPDSSTAQFDVVGGP